MANELPPVEQRLSQLEFRLDLLSDQVRRLKQGAGQVNIGVKPLEEVILEVVVTHFEVTLRQLQGLNEKGKAKPGRRLERVKNEQAAQDDARFWLLCLLRQCAGQSQQTVKTNYPWVNNRKFSEMSYFIEQLYYQPDHANRPMWRKLLEETRDLGLQYGTDVAYVEDELAYV